MKVGTCVILDQPEKMEEKLKMLHDNGIDNCQIDAWKLHLMTDEMANAVNGLMAKYGVTPTALWCGWEGPHIWDFRNGPSTLGLVPPAYRHVRTQNLCRGSDFAKKLGIGQVVTHVGFIPENPNDPELTGLCNAVKLVADHCKANGQYFLFESGQETPVAMLRCFEMIDADNLGVNLDTANLILYGKANPVDALDVIGKYVRNVHAKDGTYPTNGMQLGCETKIGEGKVDFRAFIARLHELGYDGYITIEREITGEQQAKDIIEAKNYLTSIINEIYGG